MAQAKETANSYELQRILIAAAVTELEFSISKAIGTSDHWVNRVYQEVSTHGCNSRQLRHVLIGYFCWHGGMSPKKAQARTEAFLDIWERQRNRILLEKQWSENNG